MPRCRICRKFNCSTTHRTGTRSARARRRGHSTRATFNFSLASPRIANLMPVNSDFYGQPAPAATPAPERAA